MADVFVLPSFAEGVPVVLMEAMAARCPVVATRINGIPELIEDGVTGLLVPPGRPDLLANAVERILAGPRQAERMALAAHEKIRRDYNLHSIAPQLDAIFQQMLNFRPRSTDGGTAVLASRAQGELVEERAQ
jgi:glycosyltransferase involved in cell wall biosynthesis